MHLLYEVCTCSYGAMICVTIGAVLRQEIAGISKESSYTWSLLYIIKILDTFTKGAKFDKKCLQIRQVLGTCQVSSMSCVSSCVKCQCFLTSSLPVPLTLELEFIELVPS